jgi:beta-lactam-binding protein with PASTA domain
VKFGPRARRLAPFAIVAAVGILLSWATVAFVIFDAGTAMEDVVVPAVVGLTYEDAGRRLSAIDLRITLGESRFSGSAPRSTVLAQTPASGSRVAPGSQVSVDVSAGQQRTTIPSIVGSARGEAEAQLLRANLTLGEVVERIDTMPRGIVLALRPDVGQTVPVGTAVDLVVSAGPDLLSMPDVVGQNLSDARTIIEQLGLTIRSITYDSSSASIPRTVIAQNPAPGSSIASGSIVTLRVAGTP